ncbi:MAG: hypothetical protein IT449_08965 [Phycisphaerales bacterium]|nr:hypothetical protein [Phycisphaerales bacterium]
MYPDGMVLMMPVAAPPTAPEGPRLYEPMPGGVRIFTFVGPNQDWPALPGRVADADFDAAMETAWECDCDDTSLLLDCDHNPCNGDGGGCTCCGSDSCCWDECCDDGDCDDGEYCSEGQCEDCPDPCCNDDDCAEGESCIGGQCECTQECCDDGDCEKGQYCSDGQCEGCTPGCCGGNDCDDNNPCTEDACIDGNCVHVPRNCDDNNPCTDDACNAATGECEYETDDCDDGNDCTVDYCYPGTGACVHECKDDCASCDNDGDGESDGYCIACKCSLATCGLQLQANPSLACWGGRVQLTLAVSCDPPCGSVSWHLSVDPPDAVVAISPVAGFLNCEEGSSDVTIIADLVCDPPPFITFIVEGTGSNGRECENETTIATQECVEIIGERIDQDDPTNTAWSGWADGTPIYGGSEPSTADNGRLHIDPGSGVTNIEWSAEGEGTADFNAPPTGPEATEWNLGDLLYPQPGLITFKVTITYEDGSKLCGDFDSEIGVRTDDVIVVGWINESLVSVNPVGVQFQVLHILPPLGPPVPSALQCNDLALDLSLFDEDPNGMSLSPLDRLYILHWMFKYAPNPDPILVLGQRAFRTDEDSMIDYNKVQAYLLEETNYKLFNHFQTRYTLDQDQYKAITVLRSTASVGTTKNPCGPIGNFLKEFPGQTGWKNGFSEIRGNSTRIMLINDGSPDSGAVRMFNTLMGKGTLAWIPVYWEDIGSQIRFTCSSLTDPDRVIVHNYPTYFEFRNGRLHDTTVQNPLPEAHFYAAPYPFGPIPCWSLPGSPAGGRCGNADEAPPPGTNTPLYTVPD